jgi:hypothetical protein
MSVLGKHVQGARVQSHGSLMETFNDYTGMYLGEVNVGRYSSNIPLQ